MPLTWILGGLSLLSIFLFCWQWLVACRFVFGSRPVARDWDPGITLLKPLKGADAFSRDCLRSWLSQDYSGPLQILFVVNSEADPACPLVRELLLELPRANAELVICPNLSGTNAKMAKLAGISARIQNRVVVVSDADVRIPTCFLKQLIPALEDSRVGLVHCFYQMTNPATMAMKWEAVAVNVDFWSQVLQARSLKPLDFAMGAIMAFRKEVLDEIGGFAALQNCLADDYQLGNRIARRGYRIEICPVVVECWDEPSGWRSVWKHQLRWARTIRVCQPMPYFLSILSNPTLWPLVWACARPTLWIAWATVAVAVLLRLVGSWGLQRRLTQRPPRTSEFWLPLLKDLLQIAIWIAAFSGSTVEWRGQRMVLKKDGTLMRS
jgi:ceramide glucosyltransferase